MYELYFPSYNTPVNSVTFCASTLNNPDISDILTESNEVNADSSQSKSLLSPDTVVGKSELSSICIHICSQLKKIVNLVVDFARDVCGSTKNDELHSELETKIRPFLINLDEEMTAAEKLIRNNIDISRINEERVAWLLKFNKYHLEMGRLLVELSGTIYDDLERVLSLRRRGCIGISPKRETIEHLRQMKLGMDRAERLIKQEQMATHDPI